MPVLPCKCLLARRDGRMHRASTAPPRVARSAGSTGLPVPRCFIPRRTGKAHRPVRWGRPQAPVIAFQAVVGLLPCRYGWKRLMFVPLPANRVFGGDNHFGFYLRDGKSICFPGQPHACPSERLKAPNSVLQDRRGSGAVLRERTDISVPESADACTEPLRFYALLPPSRVCVWGLRVLLCGGAGARLNRAAAPMGGAAVCVGAAGAAPAIQYPPDLEDPCASSR